MIRRTDARPAGPRPSDRGQPETRRRRRLVALAAALTTAALTTAAAPGVASARETQPRPVDRAARALAAKRCRRQLSDPLRLMRLWIRSAAYGAPSPCRLSARDYTSATPRFGRYRIAYARPLRPQPGHRLYLVYLVGKHRIGRFVLDLAPGRDRRWCVDLWGDL
jgi:hypothetical protein